MGKDINKVIRQAQDQGFEVEMRGSGHVQFTSTTGERYVSSATPSDGRAIKNVVSGLRRIGFVYDRRRGSRRGVRAAQLAAGRRRRT